MTLIELDYLSLFLTIFVELFVLGAIVFVFIKNIKLKDAIIVVSLINLFTQPLAVFAYHNLEMPIYLLESWIVLVEWLVYQFLLFRSSKFYISLSLSILANVISYTVGSFIFS